MASLTGLDVGAVFAGDYRVVRRLSEGGMGAVYVVDQISTGKQRALKVMLPQLVADGEMRRRFEQEARIGARIRSDHVVEVQAAGVDAPTGMPFLVMELLSGSDLAELVTREGPRTVEQFLTMYEQLLHAVSAAHQAQVVHRDLKPENIFLAESNLAGAAVLVKVLDFGIAKLVADVEALSPSTAAMGSPLWMAPEQTERGPVTPSADVWALGLIAYYALTGKVFWRAANTDTRSVAHLMREMLFERIPAASERAVEQGLGERLPPWFDRWFARCATRDASARYADGAAALAGLRTLSMHARTEREAGTTQQATQQAPSSAPAPKTNGARWIAGGVLGVALLVGGVLVVTKLPSGHPHVAASAPSAAVSESESAPQASASPLSLASSGASAPLGATHALPRPTARPSASSSSAPVVSAAPAASTTMPAWIVGDWSGTGHQAKADLPLTLGAIFFADGSDNIVYPSDHCAASWTLVSASATEANFTEHIYKGRCIDGGTVTLTRQGTRLGFAWRGGGDTADGELSRK